MIVHVCVFPIVSVETEENCTEKRTAAAAGNAKKQSKMCGKVPENEMRNRWHTRTHATGCIYIFLSPSLSLCRSREGSICVHVCVCEWERERESEHEREAPCVTT